jgi:hypothetical protein
MFKPEVFTSVRLQLWKYPSCNMTGAVKWWQKLLTFPKHMRSCCAIFSFLFNILLIIVCPFLLPFALHFLWLTVSIGPFDIFKLLFRRFYFLCWSYIKYPQLSTNATIVSVLGFVTFCRQIASRKMTRVSILFKFALYSYRMTIENLDQWEDMLYCG